MKSNKSRNEFYLPSSLSNYISINILINILNKYI